MTGCWSLKWTRTLLEKALHVSFVMDDTDVTTQIWPTKTVASLANQLKVLLFIALASNTWKQALFNSCRSMALVTHTLHTCQKDSYLNQLAYHRPTCHFPPHSTIIIFHNRPCHHFKSSPYIQKCKGYIIGKRCIYIYKYIQYIYTEWALGGQRYPRQGTNLCHSGLLHCHQGF